LARQERAERTRAAIIDAAAAMFDEHGFNGASLSDILTEAGVTKGALYFHFSSKEELAHALVDEQFSIQEPAQDESKIGIQAGIDLCHDMAHALQTDVRVRASIRLVIEMGTFADPTPDPYLQWIDVVRTYMEAASRRGDLRKELDPDDVARWVIGSFTGIQIASQVLTGRADIHQRVTAMWKIALPGLVPPRRLARFRPSGTKRYRATDSATA
jgi:AcrR family transcriptional regulator